MEPLTEEELGRIAAEHVDNGHGECLTCYCPGRMFMPDGVSFPCLVARLYALVLRQGCLLAAWGLPCSCDPDFDLPEAP